MFAQTALHTNTYCIIIGLAQGFWVLKHRRYWTIAGTHPGYPAFAQSLGNLAPGQHLRGRTCVSSGRLHTVYPWHRLPCRLTTLSSPQQGEQKEVQQQQGSSTLLTGLRS